MIKTISQGLLKGIKAMTFVIVLLIVSLALLQIFFRFVLNVSAPWTEEMARLCFIWMIFLGSIVVEAEGGQTYTKIFVDKLSGKLRLIWQMIIYAIEIIFNICLFIGAINSWNTVKIMTFSTVPTWNYTLLFIPLIIAAPCMILYLVLQALEYYHTHTTNKEEN